jgi:glycosyltransferase involved in cell wall biosynthesis
MERSLPPGNLRGAINPESRAGQKPSAGQPRIGVCHIASGDRWAGAEAQVAALLKQLSREPDFLLSAIVLNPGRLADKIRDCGIETRVIPENAHGFHALAREAMNFLEGKNIRILHSHRYKENLLAAWLAWRLDIPHRVQTQHGLPEPQRGFRRVKQMAIQGLDRLIMRRAADRVISVSSEMTRHLTRQLGSKRIVTIPNGVDLEEVRSSLTPQEAKERLGIPRGCEVVGTAGRLEPIKRLDIFLRAAAKIRGERPSTRFVIAGEGREAAALRALAQALGIAEDLRFLGQRDDIYDVLRAFDLMVLSSDHEGLPMILLEALGLGVAAVARAVGGIPEVIQDGRNGILVDSADPELLAQACLRALSDRALSQRLAEAGPLSVASDFSARTTAHKVAQLYLSLLAGP